MPDNSGNITQYFDGKSDAFDQKYHTHPQFRERLKVWEQAVDKYLPVNRTNQALCLDLGCGSGVISLLAAERGMFVVGFDQSGQMLAIAESAAKAKNVAQYTQYIQESIPLSETTKMTYAHSADMIICSSVLEYIEDYEQALAQMYDLLKPQGFLLISLPNQLSIYRGLERWLKKTPLARQTYLRYQHHQFTPQDVEVLFKRFNLRFLGTQLFALPFQKISGRVIGEWRPRRLATMFLAAGQK